MEKKHLRCLLLLMINKTASYHKNVLFSQTKSFKFLCFKQRTQDHTTH